VGIVWSTTTTTTTHWWRRRIIDDGFPAIRGVDVEDLKSPHEVPRTSPPGCRRQTASPVAALGWRRRERGWPPEFSMAELTRALDRKVPPWWSASDEEEARAIAGRCRRDGASRVRGKVRGGLSRD
jgi:hypothetical protein